MNVSRDSITLAHGRRQRDCHGMETHLLTRREALRARRQRPSKITIPDNVSPHVRLVFTEMRRQGWTYDAVEEGSGVRRPALKAWRHKNKPGLESLEAVFGFLGFDLVPIPRERALPSALAAALAPIADEHGMTMAATIEALVSLVARIHERPGAAPSTAPGLEEITAPLDAASENSACGERALPLML